MFVHVVDSIPDEAKSIYMACVGGIGIVGGSVAEADERQFAERNTINQTVSISVVRDIAIAIAIAVVAMRGHCFLHLLFHYGRGGMNRKGSDDNEAD